MQLDARGFVLRRNWTLPMIFVGVGALGLALALLGHAPLVGGFVAWIGLLMGPAIFVRNGFPRALPIELSATKHGVAFAGREAGSVDIEGDDILETKLVMRGREALVTLLLANRQLIALQLPHSEGRALMELLGARRVTFTTVVPYWKRFLVTLATSFLVAYLAIRNSEEWVFALPSLTIFSLLVAAVVGYVRGKVVVGTDGFTTKWLFVERFISYHDVVAIESTADVKGLINVSLDTIVRLRHGKKRLQALDRANTDSERGTEARALLHHLREGYARVVQVGAGRLDVPTLVGRGGRSEGDWLSAIDAVVGGGGSRYRVAALSSDMLEEVATDPAAAADARLGAAAALVRIGDERERTRVRVAAEACADPELRGALLAVADARDDVAAQAALRTLRR